MFIRIYNILIRILYPLVIKRYINKRKQNGKEDLKRFNERMGRPQLKRPDGKLIWLHGASVGESLSMLPLINRLLDLYPEAHVMVTTVNQLLKLGRGAVVELDRDVNDYVDIYANNVLIGHGEVVITENETIGIAITDTVKKTHR